MGQRKRGTNKKELIKRNINQTKIMKPRNPKQRN